MKDVLTPLSVCRWFWESGGVRAKGSPFKLSWPSRSYSESSWSMQSWSTEEPCRWQHTCSVCTSSIRGARSKLFILGRGWEIWVKQSCSWVQGGANRHVCWRTRAWVGWNPRWVTPLPLSTCLVSKTSNNLRKPSAVIKSFLLSNRDQIPVLPQLMWACMHTQGPFEPLFCSWVWPFPSLWFWLGNLYKWAVAGRLIRQRYRRASELSRHRGKLSCLLINDIDAGIGHFQNTQITVRPPPKFQQRAFHNFNRMLLTHDSQNATLFAQHRLYWWTCSAPDDMEGLRCAGKQPDGGRNSYEHLRCTQPGVNWTRVASRWLGQTDTHHCHW